MIAGASPMPFSEKLKTRAPRWPPLESRESQRPSPRDRKRIGEKNWAREKSRKKLNTQRRAKDVDIALRDFRCFCSEERSPDSGRDISQTALGVAP